MSSSPPGLRLTVLGSSSSIPRPNRACSSYLVESASHSLVFDLGSGAFANLRQFIEYDRIGALVITHMHADHFLDIVPLRYALKYGSEAKKKRVPLYLPPGGEAVLRRLASAFAGEREGDFLSEVFDVRAYVPEEPLQIGDIELTFAPTIHYVEAFAIRASLDGVAITYSGDTAPSAEVVNLARGSNLFLCESTLGPGQSEYGKPGHCGPAQAALMAHEAGAGELLLTHYGGEVPAEVLVHEARRHFSGDCGIADDFLQLAVG